MNQTSLTFTVFFKDPFWIGLFEYRENQMVHLKQIVFGRSEERRVGKECRL